MTSTATSTVQTARESRSFRWNRRAGYAATYLVLGISCVIFLYPMLLMLVNSFKSDSEMYVNPAGMPLQWTVASYGKIFQYHGGLWLNYINSLIIAGTSTVIAVFICAMAGFAFAKYRFPGRDLLFALLLATMMVPPEITIPGLYVLFAKLQWINTLQVQILPTVTPVLRLFLV